MKIARPKPQSLRRLSATHRRWFWAFMSIGVAVIAVGWFITIRGILDNVPIIFSQVQSSIEQMAKKAEEARVNLPVEVE